MEPFNPSSPNVHEHVRVELYRSFTDEVRVLSLVDSERGTRTKKIDSVKLNVASEWPESQVRPRFGATYPVNDWIREVRVGKTPCPLLEVLEPGHQAHGKAAAAPVGLNRSLQQRVFGLRVRLYALVPLLVMALAACHK